MSPFAGPETAFHTRMVETRSALRSAVREIFGDSGVAPADGTAGGDEPTEGVYALPEWRRSVGPRHGELVALWRKKGL